MACELQTVFVVDDDSGVREGLTCLFRSVRLAVESFADAAAFLVRIRSAAAGCVLLDARLPDLSGLEVQERLLAERIMLPVILLTGNADIAMAVRAMKSGALDFFEKPFHAQTLLERVQHALRIDAVARTASVARDATLARIARLTPREHEVVTMVARGLANKEIARDLDISAKTVELHRAKAMRKLGARHVADLVRAAVAAEDQGALAVTASRS